MRRILSPAMVLVLAATLTVGCTKRVPLQTPTFDGRTKVVLTFADGSEIRGKINLDETVTLVTEGVVYRALIVDVTDEDIALEECTFVSRDGDFTAGRDRMVACRVDLVEERPSFVFERADIQRVDVVKVDPLRTAAQSAFWTLTGAVTVFLLGEKS